MLRKQVLTLISILCFRHSYHIDQNSLLTPTLDHLYVETCNAICSGHPKLQSHLASIIAA